MTPQLRSKFERDLEDSLVLSKEVLLVLWRLNPAGHAAYTCNTLWGSITDQTPADQKAAMVAAALATIDIVPVEQYERTFGEMIFSVCGGMASEVIRGASKEYPQIETFLRERVATDEEAATNAFTRMTFSALANQRGHYQQLHGHFLQLLEHLPRYSSIMNRSGLLDGVVGFAAGFLGGHAGVAGAEAWGNWRNSNDEQFCHKFGSAFEQFCQACIQYVNEGENALSVVFDRLLDETRRVHHDIFSCYDELAEAGWDIEPLYRRYRTFDEDLDNDARQLFETALVNLEGNRSVHFRTIENLRAMLALSSSLVAPPAVEPATVFAQEATQAESCAKRSSVAIDELIASAMQHASPGSLYRGHEAPEKKLLGAIGSYAPQVKPEMVLLLWDNTLFGSAKEGFLLTFSSIHWRNSFEGAKFISFADIQTLTVSPSTSMFTTAWIHLNQEKIEVSGASDIEKNEIARHVLAIIQAIKNHA